MLDSHMILQIYLFHAVFLSSNNAGENTRLSYQNFNYVKKITNLNNIKIKKK